MRNGVRTLAIIGALFALSGAAPATKPNPFLIPFSTESQKPHVDLNLVLAVDSSGSVSDDRFELQMQGYAAAFRDPRVLRAIREGSYQSIAVTMVQWTGPYL